MILTIPVEIQIDDEPQEFQMDVLYQITKETIEVVGCFIEEIPSPSSAQQYVMHSYALDYITENEAEIAQKYQETLDDNFFHWHKDEAN